MWEQRVGAVLAGGLTVSPLPPVSRADVPGVLPALRERLGTDSGIAAPVDLDPLDALLGRVPEVKDRDGLSFGDRVAMSRSMLRGLRQFLAFSAALTPSTGTVAAAGRAWDYLDNGLIKVGVALDRGGAIGYLADARHGESVVNVHDLGRWIGQSYYAGPRPFGNAHPGWKGWPWNPVSAGDVFGHPSTLVERRHDGTTLYVKSIPMQWALDNVPGDCRFETWITLEGRSVRVRNRLTNQRSDRTQYPAMDQELPFVYTVGTLHRLMTYTGDAPFTGGPAVEVPKRSPDGPKGRWTSFAATEHWAALVDDHDWGLGVIHPGVVGFLGGFHGKPGAGGPRDDPTGYVAPVRREVLDHGIVYEFRYTLVLDTLDNIRKEAYRQRPGSPLPDDRFANDRRHWWFQNVADAGYPIRGHLRLKLEQDDPRMVGPEGCWNAKDAPTLVIRAAYHTTNAVAEVFWERADPPGFPPEQSVRFRIKPDGAYHTYRVDLSASPEYRGVIRRLRFDPVERGRPGEFVEVQSIAAIGP